MYKISDAFASEYENYITLAPLKSFIRQHHLTGRASVRQEMIELICEFADESAENAELVDSWIDETIKAGKKTISLFYYPINSSMRSILKDPEKIDNFLGELLNPNFKRHVNGNCYSDELTLVRYELDDAVDKLTLFFCRKIFIFEQQKLKLSAFDYPIIAELFLNSNWICIRATPKTNMYQYRPSTFNIEVNQKTTVDKQIKDVMEWLRNRITTEDENTNVQLEILKNRLYSLLHQYTYTPEEIENRMREESDRLEQCISILSEACCLDDVTHLKDLKDDIFNTAEKYLSISWPDKSIFTRGRGAYPIKLKATDEEESTVEQQSGENDPLQSKAIFFDNKKMLEKNKKCDGVTFCWGKRNSSGFFIVKISIIPKGCTIILPRYTEEEDIENVIFSLIENE